MAASNESAAWPAFVDVLTAVIMVVIFMLVIMSAAVLALSQRVLSQAKAERDAAQAVAMQATQRLAKSSVKVEVAVPTTSPQAAPIIEDTGPVLTAASPIRGEEPITIRTSPAERQDVAPRPVEAAAIETGRAITSADAILRVKFAPGSLAYGTDDAKTVVDRMKREAANDDTMEIWSFAAQGESISEAQRTAFYRAMLTRNLLIEAGIPPSRIRVNVRVTREGVETDLVRVVRK
ncbi:MAG: hypothetical protein INF91_01595 [Alphaproteobacteria bacterium]|nr:hypothetical protein [Alphaproteobacteria bacterium]